MPYLSVVVLSYNTKKITKDCLNILYKSLIKFNNSSEIIIIDNGSVDSSIQMIKDFSKNKLSKKISIKTLFNKKNKGFSAANNQGIKILKGKYVLFLNSDTIITNIDWEKLLHFFDRDRKIGVLTVKVFLPTGGIDPASHRGFPTLWNSFCYFIGLEKIFGKFPLIGKFFNGYHLLSLNTNEIHEVDSISGTFYLTKQSLLNRVGGFDSKHFFLYGEDLDLSYRIKELGYKVVYYPYYSVTHIKSVSGLKKDNLKIRRKTRKYFYEAMRAFYDKHYSEKYPRFINLLVHFFIELRSKNNEKNRD